jgi:hypothetical protein
LAFLVELAQVVQIIDVVSVAFGAGSFATWRKPDVPDTNGCKLWNLGNQALPVLLISRDVPLEALEEGVVLRCWFLL